MYVVCNVLVLYIIMHIYIHTYIHTYLHMMGMPGRSGGYLIYRYMYNIVCCLTWEDLSAQFRTFWVLVSCHVLRHRKRKDS